MNWYNAENGKGFKSEKERKREMERDKEKEKNQITVLDKMEWNPTEKPNKNENHTKLTFVILG